MTSKEQVAHELTMLYMRNNYGIAVRGSVSSNSHGGSGSVESIHFPGLDNNMVVGTGERNFFGIEKTTTVPAEPRLDKLFEGMVDTYYRVYSKIIRLIEKKDEAES